MLKPKKTLIHLCSLLSCLILLSGVLPGQCLSQTDKEKYFEADKCYKKLRHSPKKQKYREHWFKCIDKYQKVFVENPESSWAPAGMYQSALIYLELYKHSFKPGDRDEAVDLFQRVIKRYPSSAYKIRAKNRLKKLASGKTVSSSKKKAAAGKTVNKKKNKKVKNSVQLTESPSKTTQKTAEPEKKSTDLRDTMITGLRFWSNPQYTRVVIDADQERGFSYKLLKKDPSLKKPQRLYVDFEKSRLGQNVPKHTAINDDLLIQARAGQYTPHTVRVVVDIKSFDNYKVFSLRDPFRLVIDVWAKAELKEREHSSSDSLERLSTDNIHSSSIAKQLALGVRKIVIDPGHGGKDPGAPGYLKGVWEKDIVLKLGKKLAARMRDRLHCNVELTRSTDRYLTLEERTAIANTKNADLFISLHCNASSNRRLAGIETYFLNLATDDASITVAARENATSRKNISDLESILNDLMKNAKINESSRLATMVQSSIYKGLKRKYSRINNLGVKQAPFYVLLGARMPSILIETSFLSNSRECKRLVNKSYQEYLCDSIINGVEKYIKETNPKLL